MLLGGERKRTKGELESTYPLRSQVSEIDDSGGSCSDNCKDVNVVSVLPECSVSTTADSFPTEMVGDRGPHNHSLLNSRTRSQDDNSLYSDHGPDNMSVSSSVFEFLKEDWVPQRVPLAPTFSKPAPSKWDDAHKWIASPTSNRLKSGHPQGHGGSRKASNFGYGSQQPSMKVVVEVPDPSLVPFEEPDTKRIDSSQAKKENGAKFVSWEADPYPLPDSYGKAVVMIENCVGESATAVNLSRHDASVSIHSETTFIPPPLTARPVSMRDMGTEMTPIASQEPSRNGTPVRATTPIRSPTSSRTSTPQRAAPASSPIGLPNDYLDLNKKELSEKDLQMKTRREIMALGTQLGKMNIAAWASKEGEEDKGASTPLKTVIAKQPAKSVIETRATAWEEAEKSKYMARAINPNLHPRHRTSSNLRRGLLSLTSTRLIGPRPALTTHAVAASSPSTPSPSSPSWAARSLSAGFGAMYLVQLSDLLILKRVIPRKMNFSRLLTNGIERLLNFSPGFITQCNLASGTKQNDKSIQEFYNEMTSYWDQLTFMELAVLQTIDEYVQYREKQRLVQFLMALRDQFEPLCGAILHRSPLPSVNGAVHELIAEETRLKVDHIFPPAQSIFITSSVPRSQTHVPPAPVVLTPASHLIQILGKPKPQIPLDECNYCH
ncbi:remorin family protein [Actinidia rufa]|uniref:Remorin family protein n=1 Tax=Actinidia rufa TaxID=165716 RepID=A0A7J0H645_9ERIC|nr:remorin family protein [Actinidia rufa]